MKHFTSVIRKGLLPLTILFPLIVSAQLESSRINLAFQNYGQVYPMEKVYLHTDKPYYTTGDTLRFSGYLVDATYHQADSASGVLYVDLINQQEKEIVSHKILKVKNGLVSGSIVLSDSLYAHGAYDLRAYTLWMNNFSDAFFFHKAIQVYKTVKKPEKFREQELEEFSKLSNIQFFPEGGYLIAGTQNSVGVKAVNQFGQGINFSGFIISNKNDTVTFVRSKHLGMSNFTFVPEKEKSYSLWIAEPKHNQHQEFKLPTPKQEGYNFIVNNMGKTSIKVYATHNFSKPDRAILVAHQRGNIVFVGQAASDKNSVVFNIQKETIPLDGVVHLTLFNSAGAPQCERIVYVDKGEPLTAIIKPDKDFYGPREKVKLDITVKDHTGRPVNGNFSLAVTDGKQVKNHPFSENIETYLLLSSDSQSLNASSEISGTIEQPGYYFDKKNPNAFIHLDLLLLTQGWRRFSWSDVLKDSLALPKHAFENGITLHGQAVLPSGKPLKTVMDLVVLLNGGFSVTSTDAEGRFEVEGLDFKDSTAVLVQGLKEKGTKKRVDVHFDPPFIPAPSPIASFGNENDIAFAKEELALLLKRKAENDSLLNSFKLNQVQTLKEVEVKATRIEQDERRLLYGSSNYKTLKVDDRTCSSAISVLQMIQGKFAGVQVAGTGINMTVRIRGQEPMLVVDGMPMFDMTFIGNITPCDVEAIDIINGPSVLYNASGGVISILTRRGSKSYDWSHEKVIGVTINKIRGFDADKEFYSPKYETSDMPIVPDSRSTLYWNPSITADSEGKAHVEFWNSDEITTVRVMLEGISSGKPTTGTLEYTVK